MRSKRTLAIKLSVGLIAALLVFGYGLFQARNLIVGPKIVVKAPQNGENITEPLVVVTGVASNVTSISLDDRQISIDKRGNFSEKLLATPGYNIIKLAAQDKFGRTTQKLIELNYTASDVYTQIVATSTATSTKIIQ